MPKQHELIEFYDTALDYLLTHGYESEIDWVNDITPIEERGPDHSFEFIHEYVWVVLNAGMKEQIARKIYERFWDGMDLSTIGHPGKRAAIEKALGTYPLWWSELMVAEDKLAYLESLPWIGPITKYHLARNIGIDTVKPDRHLVRLAERFGYSSPLEMCEAIKQHNGTRLGIIDVILWRYMNLNQGENP